MTVRCLCCGLVVETPRKDPVTDGEANRALRVLARLGYTEESLRTEHRDNLNWVWPGMVDWLDERARARDRVNGESG